MGCPNHPSIAEWLQPCARCGTQFCSNCLVLIGGAQYCGQCKREVVRDVQSGAPASNASLDLAEIGMRFLALVVDMLIVGVPMAALACAGFFVILGASASAPESLGASLFANGMLLLIGLGLAAVNVVYEGLMLSRGGQTLGKKLCRVKVVMADGTDLTPGQAWLRAAMRALFGLVTCVWVADYLVAFFNPDRATLHDQVAKTRVIKWA